MLGADRLNEHGVLSLWCLLLTITEVFPPLDLPNRALKTALNQWTFYQYSMLSVILLCDCAIRYNCWTFLRFQIQTEAITISTIY